MTTYLTAQQIQSLEDKIYDSLMSAPDVGMGEMGEARDEAISIVLNWMLENNISEQD